MTKILIEGADLVQVGKAPTQLERIAMQIAMHQQAKPLFAMSRDDFKICVDKAKEFIPELNEAEFELVK